MFDSDGHRLPFWLNGRLTVWTLSREDIWLASNTYAKVNTRIEFNTRTRHGSLTYTSKGWSVACMPTVLTPMTRIKLIIEF